jgi:hypothetical protein
LNKSLKRWFVPCFVETRLGSSLHYRLIFYEMFSLKCVGSKIAFVSVDHIVDTSGKVSAGVAAINVNLRSRVVM